MLVRTAPPDPYRWAIVGIALLLKASYFLIAWATHYWVAIPHFLDLGQRVDPLDWNVSNPFAAHWILNHSDSVHYQSVAEGGYPPLTSEWIRTHETVYAFWPLLPLVMALGMNLTGWPFPVVGLLVATGVSIAAFLVFFELARRWFRQDGYRAFLATVLLMGFPFAFYFSAVYTEALFLLLAVSGYLLAEQRRWWGVALAAALITLCRANGALVALLLGLRCLEVQGVTLRRWPTFRQLLPTVWVGLSAGVALAGYLVFLHARTGDYLAFSTAQVPWGRHTSWPHLTLWQGQTSWANFQRAGYTLLFLGLAVGYLRRYPLSMQGLVWLLILVPLSSGSLASLPRFLSVLFPVFLVLGDGLANQRRPGLWVAGLLVLHWLSFLPFLHLHHSIA